MTTAGDEEFLAELIGQLFHADMLIAEQAERIEVLEAEIARLRAHIDQQRGAGGVSGRPSLQRAAWRMLLG